MKKLILYSFIVASLFSFKIKAQSNISIVIGRYNVLATYLTNSTPNYSCNGLLDLIPDSQYSPCVRQQDSCLNSTFWDANPWDILVNADSTLIGFEPWTVAAAASGRLYPNDSIYLKVKRFGDQTTWKEFRGFKLYSTVGVNDLNKFGNELLISPQPASDVVYIQSTQLVFRQEDIPVVYDISGKQLKLQTQYINGNTYKLDVSSLRAGMYVVAIKTEKGVVRKKLVIKNKEN